MRRFGAGLGPVKTTSIDARRDRNVGQDAGQKPRVTEKLHDFNAKRWERTSA
jgi:hypothetical protein